MSAESLFAGSAVPPSTQLSQLFRCGIVMPLTPADEKNLCCPLDDDGRRSDSQVDWLALYEPALTIFWVKGLFKMINDYTGANIAEYETEWVNASRMSGVQEGVRTFRQTWHVSEPEFLDVLATVEFMAENASRAGVSLVFVL